MKIISQPSGCNSIILLKVLLVIAPAVSAIVNSSLLTGSVPSYFTNATIQAILRNLYPALPMNCRPISTLPFLSKVLKKVVAKKVSVRVSETALNWNCFPEGFKWYSNILWCVWVVCVGSVFDTVDHHILIKRLRDCVDTSSNVLDWVTSYLTDRTSTVSTG